MNYFAIFDKNVKTMFQLQWKIGNISDMFLQYSVLCGEQSSSRTLIFSILCYPEKILYFSITYLHITGTLKKWKIRYLLLKFELKKIKTIENISMVNPHSKVSHYNPRKIEKKVHKNKKKSFIYFTKLNDDRWEYETSDRMKMEFNPLILDSLRFRQCVTEEENEYGGPVLRRPSRIFQDKGKMCFCFCRSLCSCCSSSSMWILSSFVLSVPLFSLSSPWPRPFNCLRPTPPPIRRLASLSSPPPFSLCLSILGNYFVSLAFSIPTSYRTRGPATVDEHRFCFLPTYVRSSFTCAAPSIAAASGSFPYPPSFLHLVPMCFFFLIFLPLRYQRQSIYIYIYIYIYMYISFRSPSNVSTWPPAHVPLDHPLPDPVQQEIFALFSNDDVFFPHHILSVLFFL